MEKLIRTSCKSSSAFAKFLMTTTHTRYIESMAETPEAKLYNQTVWEKIWIVHQMWIADLPDKANFISCYTVTTRPIYDEITAANQMRINSNFIPKLIFIMKPLEIKK